MLKALDAGNQGAAGVGLLVAGHVVRDLRAKGAEALMLFCPHRPIVPPGKFPDGKHFRSHPVPGPLEPSPDGEPGRSLRAQVERRQDGRELVFTRWQAGEFGIVTEGR